MSQGCMECGAVDAVMPFCIYFSPTGEFDLTYHPVQDKAEKYKGALNCCVPFESLEDEPSSPFLVVKDGCYSSVKSGPRLMDNEHHYISEELMKRRFPKTYKWLTKK